MTASKATERTRIAASSLPDIKSALLDALLSPMAIGKIKQRQLIAEVIPLITAMRAVGIEFDEIASILRSKGLTLQSETLRVYYFQEKSKEEKTNLALQAEMYKRMAEKVIDAFNGTIDMNTKAAVERALEKAAKLAEERRQPAGGTEIRPQTPAAADDAGSGESKVAEPLPASKPRASPARNGKNAGVSVTRSASTDETGRSRVLERAENRSPTLEEINAIFTEHIDLSTIPRRTNAA